MSDHDHGHDGPAFPHPKLPAVKTWPLWVKIAAGAIVLAVAVFLVLHGVRR